MPNIMESYGNLIILVIVAISLIIIGYSVVTISYNTPITSCDLCVQRSGITESCTQLMNGNTSDVNYTIAKENCALIQLHFQTKDYLR